MGSVDRQPGRYRAILLSLALALATVAAYQSVRLNGFVGFDDSMYLTDNPAVQGGLTVAGARWAFTTGYAGNWHPLTWLSHMLDVEAFGLDPAGHHLVGLLLHVTNALLLFGVLRSLTRQDGPSALVAALFALHPLHAESVAWAAERKDLLSTTLWMLSTWAWVAWVRRGGRARYAGAAVLLALGLMAKPMLVTLPFVFLLLDYWPLGRLRPKEMRSSLGPLVLEKLPLLLLSVASSVVTFIVQQQAGAMPNSSVVSLPLRLANAAVSYVRYLGKAIWPADLSILYPHPNMVGGMPWSAWQVVAAVALLLALTALVLRARSRPYLVVGWLWYLGTLVPVIGVVQVGVQAMADRYTYIPLIGIFVAVAFGAADGVERLGSRTRRAAVAGALVVLVACGVATWRQVEVWRDGVSLFSRALRTAPDHPGVLTTLGVALSRRGDLERGIEYCSRAVDANPAYAFGHYNLAVALMMASRFDAAADHFMNAGRDPPTPTLLNNMAWILATYPDRRGRRPAEALDLASRAAGMTRDESPTVLDTLATAHAANGHFERAVEVERRALALAIASGRTGLAEEIASRLALFERGSPYDP